MKKLVPLIIWFFAPIPSVARHWIKQTLGEGKECLLITKSWTHPSPSPDRNSPWRPMLMHADRRRKAVGLVSGLARQWPRRDACWTYLEAEFWYGIASFEGGLIHARFWAWEGLCTHHPFMAHLQRVTCPKAPRDLEKAVSPICRIH